MNVREYKTYNVVKFFPELQVREYSQKNGGHIIAVESHTVDTGERKTFFGFSARHLITTVKRAPDPKNGGGEVTIDGWYIDHELPDRNCAPDFVHADPFYLLETPLLVDYPDVAQFHHTGPLPTGLAVRRTHTLKLSGKNAQNATMEETVEELSDSPLSPSIFELPAGLHENPQLLGGSLRPSSSQ
jgi:hypothetical protein